MSRPLTPAEAAPLLQRSDLLQYLDNGGVVSAEKLLTLVRQLGSEATLESTQELIRAAGEGQNNGGVPTRQFLHFIEKGVAGIPQTTSGSRESCAPADARRSITTENISAPADARRSITTETIRNVKQIKANAEQVYHRTLLQNLEAMIQNEGLTVVNKKGGLYSLIFGDASIFGRDLKTFSKTFHELKRAADVCLVLEQSILFTGLDGLVGHLEHSADRADHKASPVLIKYILLHIVTIQILFGMSQESVFKLASERQDTTPMQCLESIIVDTISHMKIVNDVLKSIRNSTMRSQQMLLIYYLQTKIHTMECRCVDERLVSNPMGQSSGMTTVASDLEKMLANSKRKAMNTGRFLKEFLLAQMEQRIAVAQTLQQKTGEHGLAMIHDIEAQMLYPKPMVLADAGAAIDPRTSALVDHRTLIFAMGELRRRMNAGETSAVGGWAYPRKRFPPAILDAMLEENGLAVVIYDGPPSHAMDYARHVMDNDKQDAILSSCQLIEVVGLDGSGLRNVLTFPDGRQCLVLCTDGISRQCHVAGGIMLYRKVKKIELQPGPSGVALDDDGTIASFTPPKLCKNGCGRPPFRTYPTCCTHCKGIDGPHASSCANKIPEEGWKVIKINEQPFKPNLLRASEEGETKYMLSLESAFIPESNIIYGSSGIQWQKEYQVMMECVAMEDDKAWESGSRSLLGLTWDGICACGGLLNALLIVQNPKDLTLVFNDMIAFQSVDVLKQSKFRTNWFNMAYIRVGDRLVRTFVPKVGGKGLYGVTSGYFARAYFCAQLSGTKSPHIIFNGTAGGFANTDQEFATRGIRGLGAVKPGGIFLPAKSITAWGFGEDHRTLPMRTVLPAATGGYPEFGPGSGLISEMEKELDEGKLHAIMKLVNFTDNHVAVHAPALETYELIREFIAAGNASVDVEGAPTNEAVEWAVTSGVMPAATFTPIYTHSDDPRSSEDDFYDSLAQMGPFFEGSRPLDALLDVVKFIFERTIRLQA